MRVHLMGIGGAGMSALARVFLDRGDDVSGCDVHPELPTIQPLVAAGARVRAGHDPAHVAGQDALVYAPIITRGDDELAAARAAGVRVLTRAEMLADLIAGSESIAVAGSHGKTTITFMIGHVLAAAGRDPTVVVADGASSRGGRGSWLVAEADESDGSLALHRPRHGVLTQVEFDHADHFRDLGEVEALFRAYVAVIPGVALLCADDPRSAAMPAPGRRVTYGFAEGADYRCRMGERLFHVEHLGVPLAELRLRVPGRHNVQNATAALAMAAELGVDARLAAGALAEFPGAHRRLERLGTWRGAAVYDDYGHHPTEVRAILEAARELGGRRVVAVFQPHRFSRYRALCDGFADSLRGADVVVVTEIYPANEQDPGGVSSAGLAERIPGAYFAPDLAAAGELLEELVRDGDLVLLIGAGDIRRLGDELANAG